MNVILVRVKPLGIGSVVCLIFDAKKYNHRLCIKLRLHGYWHDILIKQDKQLKINLHVFYPHLLKNSEYTHIENIIYPNQNGKHFRNQTVTIKIFKYITKDYDHRIMKTKQKISKAHDNIYMIFQYGFETDWYPLD